MLVNCYTLRHLISPCTFGTDTDITILLPQRMWNLRRGLWWDFFCGFGFNFFPPSGITTQS